MLCSVVLFSLACRHGLIIRYSSTCYTFSGDFSRPFACTRQGRLECGSCLVVQTLVVLVLIGFIISLWRLKSNTVGSLAGHL